MLRQSPSLVHHSISWTGPHPVDVLLRFRRYRIAADEMYRAIELSPSDRDLHRFVLRSSPSEVLKDYRMIRHLWSVCVIICH